jgi:RimJ/RimL family protein N-acetyltransferase
MTLAHGTDRLKAARLVLRRIVPDDLPFFTHLHARPEVAQGLYPEGRPRSPEQVAAWLDATLAGYEQRALGHLAVLRKDDGALIGRCGLTELVIEATAPAQGIRRGWFGREGVPAGLALTFECELGYPRPRISATRSRMSLPIMPRPGLCRTAGPIRCRPPPSGVAGRHNPGGSSV